MVEISFKGDGFSKIIREIESRAKKLEGTNDVPFRELFTQEFLSKHTSFSSLDDMFGKSGFTINSQEDFQNIQGEEWDKFISSNSNFKSWGEMFNTAGKEWISKQLFNK
jgi:hypothetical protein